MNTSEVLVQTIRAWGVDVVFGLPGDGINGVMEALRKAREQVRFIQVRHEESAAFMACAYAKHTGRLGCCLATSGPGGIHLLNGLYDAKLDGQPVLAITGMQFHDLSGTHSQQDVGAGHNVAAVGQLVGNSSRVAKKRVGDCQTHRLHAGRQSRSRHSGASHQCEYRRRLFARRRGQRERQLPPRSSVGPRMAAASSNRKRWAVLGSPDNLPVDHRRRRPSPERISPIRRIAAF
jgi:2-succinyl-5-enolpyruvyl-6-hydroxy-3-cyclohexene-1-carboxylate synthase